MSLMWPPLDPGPTFRWMSNVTASPIPDAAHRHHHDEGADPGQRHHHNGLLHESDHPGFEVVGEAARVRTLSKRIDGGRQLVAGDVDVALDGFGVPVRHCVLQVAHCPAHAPARTTLDQLAITPNAPVNRKGLTLTETTRLTAGDKAPSFSLPDADGNKVSLADYKGRRVVVYFYPAASTPGCTKQACDFRDNLHDLNDAGLDVIGISPDKPEKLAKFRDAEKLTFPLLSDPDRKVLTAYGAYGEKQMYGKTVTGVIRSTFVVDDKGKIAIAQYNVKAARTTTNIQKILAQVAAAE
jgi:thioredoxin-dependent peroxiredoxin